MNYKTISISLAILSCITALGSLQAMADPENLPLASLYAVAQQSA